MKKVLLGTTALLGVSMLALPASAQSFDPDGDFSLTLEGEVEWEASYVSDADPGDRSHWFETGGNMVLTGESELNYGIAADFEIEFEFEDDDGDEDVTVDDMWMHLEASWGQLWLGERGHITNDDATIVRNYPGGAGLDEESGDIGGNNAPDEPENDLDSIIGWGGNKDMIAYQTPEMSGFTFTINYTPEDESEANGDSDTDDAGERMNMLLSVLEWEGAVGNVPVLGVLGYATAAAEDNTAGTLATDDTRWYAGVLLNEDGVWEVGGYYGTLDDAAVDDAPSEEERYMGIGATYEMGNFTLGAGYETASHDEPAPATGSDTVTRWDVGVTYAIDDSREVTVGYRRDEWDDNDNVAADEGDNSQYGIEYEWDINDDLEFAAAYQYMDYAYDTSATDGANGNEWAANVELSWDLGNGVEWGNEWEYQQHGQHEVTSTVTLEF